MLRKGTSAVTLRLGAVAVAKVYLGAVQVHGGSSGGSSVIDGGTPSSTGPGSADGGTPSGG